MRSRFKTPSQQAIACLLNFNVLVSTRLCADGPNNNTALDLCDGIEVAPARSAQVRTQQNVTVNLVVAQMRPVTAAGRQAVEAGCQSARQRPGQPQSQLAAGSSHHGRRTPRLTHTHGVIIRSVLRPARMPYRSINQSINQSKQGH